ncbi:MAG: Mur ligase family protein [Bdellovibrionota bacterium]|jgi:UDP-N-acetylmuramate--alanine ligase
MTPSPKKKIYFCGVGGNGMSPLARLLAARGEDVYGSDRSYDQGRNGEFFKVLKQEGISLVPQDGSALDPSFEKVVVTRAVEDSIPDIKKARELGIPIQKRPALMAEICQGEGKCNIAVGGTGGKSTTTAMIGHILTELGRDPTIINGAIMLNNNSNIRNGAADLMVFEADESDGMNDVIALCPASIGVLTNISLDHFELDELKEIFGHFISHAKEGVVLNADCVNSLALLPLARNVRTFGLEDKGDITPKSVTLNLQVLGKHNLANALAAVAACSLLGIAAEEAAQALTGFKGIKRRLELVSDKNGIMVFDDFASNPAKIRATLETLKSFGRRLIIIFQPHGFQPTKMMREGYVEVFSHLLDKDDILLMPEIYYVGGTANLVDGKVVPLPKDISSKDLVDEIVLKIPQARYFEKRSDIPPYLSSLRKSGDIIGVLGSRDETLPDFSRELAE